MPVLRSHCFLVLFFSSALLLCAQTIHSDSIAWTAKSQKAYTQKLAFVKAEQKSILNEVLQQQKRFERKLLRQLKKSKAPDTKEKYQNAKAIITERKAQLARLDNKTQDLKDLTGDKLYVPLLDTINSATAWLNKNPLPMQADAQKILDQVQNMEGDFKQGAASLQTLNQYNERLQTAVADVKGTAAIFEKYTGPIKAYSEVLNDLRAVFKNPDVIETKLMKYLRHIPGLDGYIAEQGEFAQHFPSQASTNDPARLQTIAIGAIQNLAQNAQSQNPTPNHHSQLQDIQSVIQANQHRPRRNYDNLPQQIKNFKRPVKPYFNLAIRGYEKWYPNTFDVQAGLNIKNKYQVLCLAYLNTRYQFNVQKKLYSDRLMPALALEFGKSFKNTFTLSAGSFYNFSAFSIARENKEAVFNTLLSPQNQSFSYFANAAVKILQVGKASLNMGLRWEGNSKDPHSLLNINLGLQF